MPSLRRAATESSRGPSLGRQRPTGVLLNSRRQRGASPISIGRQQREPSQNQTSPLLRSILNELSDLVKQGIISPVSSERSSLRDSLESATVEKKEGVGSLFTSSTIQHDLFQFVSSSTRDTIYLNIEAEKKRNLHFKVATFFTKELKVSAIVNSHFKGYVSQVPTRSSSIAGSDSSDSLMEEDGFGGGGGGVHGLDLSDIVFRQDTLPLLKTRVQRTSFLDDVMGLGMCLEEDENNGGVSSFSHRLSTVFSAHASGSLDLSGISESGGKGGQGRLLGLASAGPSQNLSNFFDPSQLVSIPLDEIPDFQEMAFHWFCAGHVDKQLVYLVLAADNARMNGSPLESIEMYLEILSTDSDGHGQPFCLEDCQNLLLRKEDINFNIARCFMDVGDHFRATLHLEHSVDSMVESARRKVSAACSRYRFEPPSLATYLERATTPFLEEWEIGTVEAVLSYMRSLEVGLPIGSVSMRKMLNAVSVISADVMSSLPEVRDTRSGFRTFRTISNSMGASEMEEEQEDSSSVNVARFDILDGSSAQARAASTVVKTQTRAADAEDALHLCRTLELLAENCLYTSQEVKGLKYTLLSIRLIRHYGFHHMLPFALSLLAVFCTAVGYAADASIFISYAIDLTLNEWVRSRCDVNSVHWLHALYLLGRGHWDAASQVLVSMEDAPSTADRRITGVHMQRTLVQALNDSERGRSVKLRSFGDRSEREVCFCHATIAAVQGDLNKALSTLNSAGDTFHHTNDVSIRMSCLNLHAYLLLQKNEASQAVHLLEEAQNLGITHDSVQTFGTALLLHSYLLTDPESVGEVTNSFFNLVSSYEEERSSLWFDVLKHVAMADLCLDLLALLPNSISGKSGLGGTGIAGGGPITSSGVSENASRDVIAMHASMSLLSIAPLGNTCGPANATGNDSHLSNRLQPALDSVVSAHQAAVIDTLQRILCIFREFSDRFTFCRGMLKMYEGYYDFACGNLRSARRLWSDAAAASRSAGLAYHQGLSEMLIAASYPLESHSRMPHLKTASNLFSQSGASKAEALCHSIGLHLGYLNLGRYLQTIIPPTAGCTGSLHPFVSEYQSTTITENRSSIVDCDIEVSVYRTLFQTTMDSTGKETTTHRARRGSLILDPKYASSF